MNAVNATSVERASPSPRAELVLLTALAGSFIANLTPASGAQFALLPPDNATGNFTRIVQRVPVRVALMRGQAKVASLRPGMSATVRVRN